MNEKQPSQNNNVEQEIKELKKLHTQAHKDALREFAQQLSFSETELEDIRSLLEKDEVMRVSIRLLLAIDDMFLSGQKDETWAQEKYKLLGLTKEEADSVRSRVKR